MKLIKCICQVVGKKTEGRCQHCNDTGMRHVDDAPASLGPFTTCIEHAYGTTYRLPFQIKVF